MEIRAENVYDAWTELLLQLLNIECPGQGHRPAPRGQVTRELLGAQLRVNNLRLNLLRHPVRNLNVKFAIAAWLWVAFGLNDLAILTRYNSRLSLFSDNGATLAGAYGPRLTPQWPYVLAKLREDRDTRQAVASIWTPSPAPSRDIPCTLSLQFLIRDGRLHLIVTMRSSDVWLGMPYDAYTFSQLANGLAGELGVATGSLIMNLGSSHLYETDVERARTVVNRRSEGDIIGSPILSTLCPEPGLYGVLTDPDRHDEVLPDPWDNYRRVLRSGTWREAYEILAGRFYHD